LLDRLTGLEVFAKVAAAGSLSAAGRTMGISQTMVTKHIAALTTRRLSITEAGRSYLESSERILAEMEAADAAVAADRVEPRGPLRLNAPVNDESRLVNDTLSRPPSACESSRVHRLYRDPLYARTAMGS
jgi:DNA-binding transcriptional LysR family regulator